MKQSDTSALAAQLGLAVPASAVSLLERYEQLLRSRAMPLGVVAASDEPVLRQRHIDDCLRAAPLVAGRVADLGSGGGLPGIVIAIVCPAVEVDLIEPRRRRLAFLELAVDELDLPNARPVLSRAEDVRRRYDVAVARAFGDARRSWMAAERLLDRSGRLVYFAGAGFDPASVFDLGVRANVVSPPAPLASAGPLVIMTRQ